MSIRASDMGKHHRLVYVESPRISGTFAVLLPRANGPAWVKSHDVVVWADEEHTWGRTFGSYDLTGSVRGGVAELKPHMVASDRLDDVKDVWDDMLAVLAAAADAAGGAS